MSSSRPTSGARAALVAALVLGVALAVVIAVRTPWTVLPEPAGGHAPLDPTAGLSAAQVHRAESFAALLRPASLVSLALGLAVAGAARRSPRSAAGWSGPSPGPWAAAGCGRCCSASWRCGDRPPGHAAAGGVRGGGLAPLRAVHAQLGAVAARRRGRHGDRRRADGRWGCWPWSGWPAARRAPGGPGGRCGGRAWSWSGRSSGRCSSSRPSTGSADGGRTAAQRPAGARREERHAGAGRAGVRREPAHDGAERLRLGVRLDPAHRRLRHGPRAAARRADRVDRRARARSRRRRTTSSPARSSGALGAAAGVAALGWLLSLAPAAPAGRRGRGRRSRGSSRSCCS